MQAYRLSFSHTQYEIPSIDGDVRGNELMVARGTLVQTSLSGRVIDGSGRGIGGVAIDAGACGHARSRGNGSFVLPSVPPGTNCRVAAKHAGISFPQSQTVWVSHSGASIQIVGAREKYSLFGRVLFNSRPVSGATIRVSRRGVLRASANGLFKLKNIEYGTRLRLVASSQGYKTSTQTVVVNSTRRVSITLRRR